MERRDRHQWHLDELSSPKCSAHASPISQRGLESCVQETVRAFDDAGNYALYPDVLPCLHALHERGLTLGVISDWGVSLSLILRHYDLIAFFDFAVISAQARRAKPDPQLFQTALERADAIPDYTLHIGDSYVLDVLGARRVGITPILLDRRRVHDPARSIASSRRHSMTCSTG